MNYTRLDKGNYRLHVIETDKFKTITMRVCFRRTLTEEMITEREILCGMLSNSTEACPTLKELIMKKEDLYQMSFGYSTKISGKYSILTGYTYFIHEKYTEKGMNEATIRFFLDSLFHPNVEGDCFSQNAFLLEKRNYLEYLEGNDDNPNQYISKRYHDLIGKGTPMEWDPNGNIEILKALDEKKLYQEYKNMLKEDCLDIFVIGQVTPDFLEKICEEYFQDRKEIKCHEPHFLTLLPSDYQEVIEHQQFKQSKLKICYEIQDITEFERRYVFAVYNFILGGDSDSLLFQEIREKNSLCYAVHSSTAPSYSFFTISAGIEATDYEKTLALAKEQVEKMRRGEFSDEEVSKVILNYQTSYKEILDNPSGILNIYESHEYIGYDFLEDRILKIATVTKEDIIQFASKINIKAVYFLEGNDDHARN